MPNDRNPYPTQRPRSQSSDLPRYLLITGNRKIDPMAGSYVGALVAVRNAALSDPGHEYELQCDGRAIARYTARDGKIEKAWIL